MNRVPMTPEMRARRLLLCVAAGSVMIAVGVCLTGCVGTSDSHTDAVSTPTIFQLSFSERKALEATSTSDDGSSAFRLYQYYLFSREDEDAALRWLEVGAGRGHLICMHNLAFTLIRDDERRDPSRASKILDRATEIATERGDTSALESMRVLREELDKRQPNQALQTTPVTRSEI